MFYLHDYQSDPVIFILGAIALGATAWCLYDIRLLRAYGDQLSRGKRRRVYIRAWCLAVVAIISFPLFVIYIVSLVAN